MKQRIVLSTGGTGGHVFPALSLACELKKRGFAVDLVTDQRGAIYQDSQYFDRVLVINIPKSGSILRKLYQAFGVLYQTIRSVFAFLCDRPAIVVGFGGYTSAPVVLSASLLCIPVIIHEQNAVLGRVNRFMGRVVRKIALGMPVTHYTDGKSSKTVFVGNPVRQEVLEAQKKHLNPDKLFLFVFGGSQGADLFARIVPKAVALLPDHLQEQLVITHQARDDIRLQVLEGYHHTKASTESVQSFFSDMPMRLAQSDLIICRAGAMTVTEIAVVGRSAIFIPLKISMDNHQYWNVKPLVDAQAAEMILETELTPESLAGKLGKFIESAALRQEMAEKIKGFCMPDAAKSLADLVEAEFRHQK